MKTTKYILKGILLWVTVISILCFIAGGFESLIGTNWLALGFWLVINIALGYICYYTISYRELYIISGNKWFDEVLSDE